MGGVVATILAVKGGPLSINKAISIMCTHDRFRQLAADARAAVVIAAHPRAADATAGATAADAFAADAFAVDTQRRRRPTAKNTTGLVWAFIYLQGQA